MQLVTDWFRRNFSDPQVVYLAVLLLAGFAVVIWMGNMLAPVLASVVIAYMLEGLVGLLEKRGVPRLMVVMTVFILFMLFVILVLFGLLPQLSHQVTQLFQQIPTMISEGQAALMQLPERYPEFVSARQVDELIGVIRRELAQMGQQVLLRKGLKGFGINWPWFVLMS